MIHEIVIQHVAPEKRDEYIEVFGEILKKANYAGSTALNFFASIEDPSRVILMIEWDSVEAHTQHPRHADAQRHARSAARYQTQKSDGAHFNLHPVKTNPVKLFVPRRVQISRRAPCCLLDEHGSRRRIAWNS